MDENPREYLIRLVINKKDGFIPVVRVSKIIGELGGEHKYNALLKVKDGDREYTINAIMTEKSIKGLVGKLKKMPDILRFSYIML